MMNTKCPTQMLSGTIRRKITAISIVDFEDGAPWGLEPLFSPRSGAVAAEIAAGVTARIVAEIVLDIGRVGVVIAPEQGGRFGIAARASPDIIEALLTSEITACGAVVIPRAPGWYPGKCARAMMAEHRAY